VGREVRAVPGASPLTADGRASIGAYLRSQRLLRGIGLGELSAATRIPRRSLERLEGGDFDDQPDGFARGFVRAVATALGLDPDDAVSRMLTEVEVPAEPGRELPLGRAALLLGAVAVLAAVAALWISLAGGPEAPRPVEGDVVMRRDAVRALAAEVAASGGVSAADPAAPGRGAAGGEAAGATGGQKDEGAGAD
jgi:hypothetical protein